MWVLVISVVPHRCNNSSERHTKDHRKAEHGREGHQVGETQGQSLEDFAWRAGRGQRCPFPNEVSSCPQLPGRSWVTPRSAEQGDPWKEVCLSPAGPGVFHWSSALAKEGNMPCKIMLRQETLPGAKGYVKGPTGDTQPLEWCLEDQPRNSHTL